ncbi:hypothetical protein DPMN_046584 [Dreissena polymorpha]|uniref:Uncharacterized protein n=1 Tax=Dreissena polymorpha TaxID=45954 RepID=A0A9D4D8B0_DREPO|nr:hypothetical protein DPMN_046584 [Dreissena polymorpha]
MMSINKVSTNKQQNISLLIEFRDKASSMSKVGMATYFIRDTNLVTVVGNVGTF